MFRVYLYIYIYFNVLLVFSFFKMPRVKNRRLCALYRSFLSLKSLSKNNTTLPLSSTFIIIIIIATTSTFRRVPLPSFRQRQTHTYRSFFSEKVLVVVVEETTRLRVFG